MSNSTGTLHRHNEVERILEHAEEIPSLSPVVGRVLSLVSASETSARDLGLVIQNDNALTLRILKVVNSAFYGVTHKISTVSHAVVTLGFNTIKNLVLSMSIMEILIKDADQIVMLKELWERSLFIGVTSKQLAIKLGLTDPEEAFMAGLLADIGMLVFIRNFNEEYMPLVTREKEGLVNLDTLESDMFQVDHAELGARLAEKWGFPESLVTPIRFHHQVPEELDDEGLLRLSRVVHFARDAASIFFLQNRESFIQSCRLNGAEWFGLPEDDIDGLLSTIQEEVEKTATYFGMRVEERLNFTQVLQEANKELSRLNLTYEQMNRELIAANKRAEELARQLREANEKLKTLVNVDPLTQVYNRRYFNEFIQVELERARRYHRELAMIIFDIDHFKLVNDNYGHLQGDSILTEMAQLVKNLMRQSDMVARYGGEEFVVILPETTLYSARIAAEKIRRSVEQHAFEHLPGEPMHITISLGIAGSAAALEKDDPVDAMIKTADDKLYQSKENGRNRVSY